MATEKITPNIWFNRNAADAVDFYASIFKNFQLNKTSYYGKEGFEFHHMPEGTVLTIEFEIEGQKFVALNAGPEFPLNPAISFMVMCPTEAEVETLWAKLTDNGEVLMELESYDWSPKYGWCNDKFGVSWQLYLINKPYNGQKIAPTLMFTQDKCGRAEEAINFYTSIFEDSKIEGILKYTEGDDDKEGLVKHSSFTIRNYDLMATDSSHEHTFTFNEGVSFIVRCNNQEEVDRYWDALLGGGEEIQCGWLKDQFGISWQIVPKQLYKLLNTGDKEKASRVMNAMFKMKKLIVADLEAAAE